MAMRCGPNSWVSARIVVIKLLVKYGPVQGPLCSQNCSSEAGGTFWKIWA